MEQTQTLEIQALISTLKDLRANDKLEGELLRKKLTRQLYTLLGVPSKEDFPDIYATAGWGWKKHAGYTKYMDFMPEDAMLILNSEKTDWQIDRASMTKVRIVDEYVRAGWHCRVQAYNVICTKYVKHPRIDNLWVEFYSSRDCNKYEYVIEVGKD